MKVLHCDTAHWSFNNSAERERLRALEVRRGVRLRPRRQMPESGSDRVADVLTYLGNDFTRGTYPDRGKPMVRIPVSVPHTYDWPEGRDFERARSTFLWFGSGGLVHKGLDLVLEAFAGMPRRRLVVCGPISRERDFAREYGRELYGLPNVRTLGWIDVGSKRFRELARGRTTIVISHRFPTVRTADRIIVLEGGGVVEEGTHDELVARDTRYARMFTLQAQGYR